MSRELLAKRIGGYPGVRVALEFKPHDLWIGAFWTRRAAWGQWDSLIGYYYELWVCIIPMLPIHVSWSRDRGGAP